MGISEFFVRRARYEDPNSLGSRLRMRRSRYLVAQLEDLSHEFGHVNVIDIGGTRQYWNALPQHTLDKFNVHVTIVNLPGADLPPDEPRFRYKEGDACNLFEVEDRQFHLAHSNSVVEHVGRWGDMRRFATEVMRVAHHHYVQTPYFWFPIEPHFMAPIFHWLPESIRIRLLLRFKIGHLGGAKSVDDAMCQLQGAQLLDKRQFQTLFVGSDLRFERLLGIPKSLMATR